MKFCNKCGALLLPHPENPKKGLYCSACGIKSKEKTVKIKEYAESKTRLQVVDKTVETLPKMKMDCEKCKAKEAYYWTAQTRSSDEAETQFFKCVKCGHQWRQY